MQPPSPPTVVKMADLAKWAGCSVNTISLALRGSHRISEVTRERIQKLARDKGYRPNPLVSALVSSRRKSLAPQTLALLTKFEKPFQEIKNPPQFCVELLHGMRAKASELGFSLEEFRTSLPDAPDAKKLTSILLARGVRGVILFPSGYVEVPFPDLDWRHFAVVVAGFHARQWPMHRTYLDQGRSVEMCLDQLTARGYRRIALGLTQHMDPRWSYAVSGRFLSWQLQQPEADRIPFIVGDKEFSTEEDFNAWVLRHRPEVVLVYDDVFIVLLEKLRAKHQIEVLAVTINATARPDIPGINQRIEELGRTSISVLARELYLNHYGIPAVPEVTLVSGEWREGVGLRPMLAKLSHNQEGLPMPHAIPIQNISIEGNEKGLVGQKMIE